MATSRTAKALGVLGTPAGSPALGLPSKGGGRLRELDRQTYAAGAAGTITATQPCTALIYLRGAGGAGVANTDAPGGGGGAALFKQVRLRKNDQLAYVIGAGVGSANGGDTIVTLPSGARVVAGGGKVGSGQTGGAGGIASGGDINRNGGAGGNDTGVATAGSAGQGAGAGTGGANSSEGGNGVAGGGGAAGITEEPLFPAAANGAAGGTNGTAYGAGGGGRNVGGSPIGGDGVGVIALIRIY